MPTSIIARNRLDVPCAFLIIDRTHDAVAAGILTFSIHALNAEMTKRIAKIAFMKKDETISTR